MKFFELISFLLNLCLLPSCQVDSFNNIPKSPVICPVPKDPAVYRLNTLIDCDTLSRKSSGRNYKNATLYKLNLSKYNTGVWSCQKVRRIDVYYKGFGPTYKLNQKLVYLRTTAEECREIVESKYCRTGDTIEKLYQLNNELWSTNLSSVVYVKPFQIKSYNVTNCFLTSGTAWINRFINKLESSFGSVAHCNYLDGVCNLPDNLVLVWNPKPKSKCLYTPWKSVQGFVENNVWFSAEGEPIALTFDNNLTPVTDECGHTFYKTDQGIGISIRGSRKKRNVEDIGGYNPVTQSEVNMKLQGIVRGVLSSPDVNGLSASCAIAQEMAYSWRDEFYVNPTMVARRILRNHMVKAAIKGRALVVWSCSTVESYSILPMRDFCTEYLPIVFNLTTAENKDEEYVGYMDPSTNEIHINTKQIKCDQMESIILELDNTFYRYNYRFGIATVDFNLPSFPTYFAPSIDVSRNNTNSLLSSIIYKASSMYNRSEYMHFVDTNLLYRFMHHEKLKSNMFMPVLKLEESGISFVLPDIKRAIGELLNSGTTWWSILYWFAIAISIIVTVGVILKLICLCCNFRKYGS